MAIVCFGLGLQKTKHGREKTAQCMHKMDDCAPKGCLNGKRLHNRRFQLYSIYKCSVCGNGSCRMSKVSNRVYVTRQPENYVGNFARN